MKNTTKNNIIYGIIGLALGVSITSSVVYVSMRNHKNPKGMHRMPHGTMMHDSSAMNMHSMMNDMMSELEGKTGDAFDKAFLSEMIVHHEGAVDMAKAVLVASKRPELITLANDIISTQTKEIATMQEWKKAWFNQ